MAALDYLGWGDWGSSRCLSGEGGCDSPVLYFFFQNIGLVIALFMQSMMWAGAVEGRFSVAVVTRYEVAPENLLIRSNRQVHQEAASLDSGNYRTASRRKSRSHYE